LSEQLYRYWAFISYSHHDVREAVQLHRWLERYVVPRRLVERASPVGALPKRLFPIFRDRDELPSSAELGGVISRALRSSRYLIVVCSPRAAASRWVNEEIRQFKALGRGGQILALILDGEPNAADPEQECFPPALRWDNDADGTTTAVEPIAADVRRSGDGESLARMKLVSGLLNVGLDELLRRERRRQLERRVSWAAGITAVLALAASSLMWQQRIYREQEHATRLVQLVENGRQELLAGSQMRAAVYLSEAYSEGVDTPALRFMLHQAMQPIDALRRVIDSGSAVQKMQLSRDDHTLVTFSINGDVSAWSLPEAKKIAQFRALDLSAVQSYCGPIISADGELLAIASVPALGVHGSLFVWSLVEEKLLLNVPIAAFNCGMSMPFNIDSSAVVAIASDGHPRIWPLKSDKSWTVSLAEVKGATTATFSPDGRWLSVGARGGGVWLWKVGSTAPPRHLPGLDKTIMAVEFSVAGDLLVASSDDGAMRGWALPSGQVAFAGGHAQQIYRLELATQSKRLLTSGLDGERVWNTENGSLLYAGSSSSRLYSSLRADGEQLCKVEWRQTVVSDVISSKALFKLDTDTKAALFTRDGQQILTADSIGDVMFWSDRFRPLASASHGVRVGEAPTWWTSSVDFALLPNDRIVSGGQDGHLLLWKGRALKSSGGIGSLAAPITTVAATPDGKRVAAATVAGEIGVWNVSTASLIKNFVLPEHFISTLTISGDGQYLFAGDRANVGRLWRIDSGQLLAEYPMDSRFSVDFSPDSKRFAIGKDRSVQIFNLDSLKLEFSESLAGDSPLVGCVKFDRLSHELVAMADDDSGAALWMSLTDHRLIRKKIPDAAGCFDAEFNPDGKRVLLESGGSSVSIWRPDDGYVLKTGEHSGPVYDSHWSPDGQFVVTAGTDGVAKIYDASSGILLQDLAIHAGQVPAVAYSQDGSTLYSGADDGRVQSWEASLETRPASDLAGRVACVSPWSLRENDTKLTSRPVNLAACVSQKFLGEEIGH
jgi:WD40 repeat protein